MVMVENPYGYCSPVDLAGMSSGISRMVLTGSLRSYRVIGDTVFIFAINKVLQGYFRKDRSYGAGQLAPYESRGAVIGPAAGRLFIHAIGKRERTFERIYDFVYRDMGRSAAQNVPAIDAPRGLHNLVVAQNKQDIFQVRTGKPLFFGDIFPFCRISSIGFRDIHDCPQTVPAFGRKSHNTRFLLLINIVIKITDVPEGINTWPRIPACPAGAAVLLDILSGHDLFA
jgi:hypothetical protein